MTSKDELIKQEIKDLNRFDDNNIPRYILDFISSLDINLSQEGASEKYPSLIKSLPNGMSVPTFNQWMYFWTITKRDRLASALLGSIEYYQGLLIDLKSKPDTDPKELLRIESRVLMLQDKYEKATKDILKYTNDGMNRETPRKVVHEYIPNPNDIAELLDWSKKRTINITPNKTKQK